MFFLSRTEKERRKHSLRALAALVVIFVLPLPWGHTHHHYADAPADLFQSHLLLYHPGDSGTDPVDHDWHLHWKICGAHGPTCLCCPTDVVPQAVIVAFPPPSPETLPPVFLHNAVAQAASRCVRRRDAVPHALGNTPSLLHRLCVLRL